MTYPFFHIGDVLAVYFVSLSATIAPILLPMLLGSVPNSDLLLLLLPLLGSLLMTGAAILLNPEPETRRIVIGRSIIAVMFGVAGPQVVAMLYPKFDPETVKPAILAIMGSLVAFVFYVMSRPLFTEAYKRSKTGAKLIADEAARRANLPTPKPQPLDYSEKPPTTSV